MSEELMPLSELMRLRVLVLASGESNVSIIDTAIAAHRLQEEVGRLKAENEAMRKGLIAVEDLINESVGVSGLHLNGDVALWGELRTSGRFEEWLIDFDAAMKSGGDGD